jgi:uncharacterized membrane protein
MMPARSRGLDMETLVGGILLAGLLGSIGCIVAGLLWHRVEAGAFTLDYELPATDVVGFLRADARTLFSLHAGPRRLVDLGIGILMATPYVRVLASLAYFLVVRNWKYALFTITVLTTLTYGLFR